MQTRRNIYKNPDNDPNDFRLVFEIEFVKTLFKDYKPVELEIWHTFTDTTMDVLLNKASSSIASVNIASGR